MKTWNVGGNLASNAVVRNMEGDRDLLTFVVASNGGRKKADFIDCVVSGKKGFADNLLPYLVTGKSVMCRGKAVVGKPTEKESNIYNNIFCSMRSLYQVELIGGNNVVPAANAESITPQASDSTKAASNAAQESAESSAPDYDQFDDDIPF